MHKTRKSLSYIDNSNTFRQVFTTSLSKLSEPSTVKNALDEIRELFISQLAESERVLIVINILSDDNEFHKPAARKEYIKLFGILSEVLEHRLLEYLPKITGNLSKRLKESDALFHTVISDTIGSIIEHSVKKLESAEATVHIGSVLRFLFTNCLQSNKNLQTGSCMSITKIIQSSPVECLLYLLDEIPLKLVEILKFTHCKCQTQVLESFLSLILGVEDRFEEFVDSVLPLVLDCLNSVDWTVRKIAIDVVYTMTVLMPEKLLKEKQRINDSLKNCKFDKIKNVREAAKLTSNLMRELSHEKVDCDDSDLIRSPESKNQKGIEEKFSSKPKQKLQVPTVAKTPGEPTTNEKKGKILLEKKNSASSKQVKSIFETPANSEFFRNMIKTEGQVDIKESKYSSQSPLLSHQPVINLDIQSSTGVQGLAKKSSEMSSISNLSNPVSCSFENDVPIRSGSLLNNTPLEREQQAVGIENKTIESLCSEVGHSSKEESISAEMESNDPYQKIVLELEKVIESQNQIINAHEKLELSLRSELARQNTRLQCFENMMPFLICAVEKISPEIAWSMKQGLSSLNNSKQTTDIEEQNTKSEVESIKSDLWSANRDEEEDESEVCASATSREIQKANLGLHYNTVMTAKNPQIKFSSPVGDKIKWNEKQADTLAEKNFEKKGSAKEYLGRNINHSNQGVAATQSNTLRAANTQLPVEDFFSKNSSICHNTSAISNGIYFSNFSEIENKYSMPHPLSTDAGVEKENRESGLLFGKANLEDFSLQARITNYIKDNKFNEAYGLALTSNDEKLLFGTMDKTGICVEKFDEMHLEFLLTKLKGIILNKPENMSRALPWLLACNEKKISLSPLLMRSLSDSLKKVGRGQAVNFNLALELEKVINWLDAVKV